MGKNLDDFIHEEGNSSQKPEIHLTKPETQEKHQQIIKNPESTEGSAVNEVTESSENKFQCAICDEEFENRTRLTLHIELKHTNALAYDKKKQADSFKELFCPFCEKTFRDKNEFTGHI